MLIIASQMWPFVAQSRLCERIGTQHSTMIAIPHATPAVRRGGSSQGYEDASERPATHLISTCIALLAQEHRKCGLVQPTARNGGFNFARRKVSPNWIRTRISRISNRGTAIASRGFPARLRNRCTGDCSFAQPPGWGSVTEPRRSQSHQTVITVSGYTRGSANGSHNCGRQRKVFQLCGAVEQ